MTYNSPPPYRFKGVDVLHDDSGPTQPDTKLSNPKDVIGSRKLDLGLVPDTAIAGLALALTEGALKYGRYNWRIAGVRASIYHAAAKRHLAKWWNGQAIDPKTALEHLDNAMACLAIIRDAGVFDKLVDDRPPCPNDYAVANLIDDSAERVELLKELFKDSNAHQYTISDTKETTVE